MTPWSVRNRLQDVLPDGVSFEAFCCDHFPAVHRRFGTGMDRQSQTTLLMSLHSPQEIAAALLQWQRVMAPVPSPALNAKSHPWNGRKSLMPMVFATACIAGFLLARWVVTQFSASAPQRLSTNSTAMAVVDMGLSSAFVPLDLAELIPAERARQEVSGSVQAYGASTIVIGNQNQVVRRTSGSRR